MSESPVQGILARLQGAFSASGSEPADGLAHGDAQTTAAHAIAEREPPIQARDLPAIMVTACLGVILAILAWFMVAQWEDTATELEFRARATNINLNLQAGSADYFNKVASLRALFDASMQGVTRTEFEIFAREILKDQNAILSASWVPRVTREQRKAHEAEAVANGIRDYQIRTVGSDGTLRVSPEQDEYFPVFYTINNESAAVYGFDLGDNAMREDALRRARDGDQLAASKVFLLQSGIGDRRGFFVLLPVYRPGEPHTTLEQRRENLMGFVLGVFQTSVMVETILRSVRSPTDLYLFEPGSGPDAMPVYTHSSKMRTRPAEPKPLGELTSQFHRAGELRVGDRQWTLLALPIPSGAIAKHLSAWIMLLAGIATTGIIVTFMVLSSRHTQMLVRANRKVSELARTDALTRLPNRRAFVGRLNEAFAASRRNAGAFAVLYFDLDHFKDVNDTLGHPTGDLLLLQVAARLESVVRATDVVARFGGDEFAVLQSDASDLATTSILARKIVEALAAPYNLNGNEVHTTASAGIAIGSAGQGDSDSVMRQADLALYRAKADGRNCFRFHSEHFDREVRERVSIADDLRLAIDRDELELHYQPQVELKSGRITGLEALLRWNHPMRGTISPVIFIPIAERTGSIVQLGRWVLEEACRQLRTWQDDGIAPDLLGVNVSAIQCRQTDFQRDVLDCLARWKIDPALLEIELTESVLMEGTQQQRGIVERLRQIGLRIAIDDFGTGYSSLAYLTNYPVDRLKIAQELVIKVNEDKRHQVVVRSAIRLAEELGVKLIAEGVQTKAQVDFLMASGCEYAQGFYYSRPVTAERATELLRQRIIKVAEPPARSKPRAVA